MTDDDSQSLDAARIAAARDELGAWVAEFLASPGSDNAALGEELRRLSDTALLFLGFRLDQGDFRVLFRSIMHQEGRSRRRR